MTTHRTLRLLATAAALALLAGCGQGRQNAASDQLRALRRGP